MITRDKIKKISLGICKYASTHARTDGDKRNYQGYQIPMIHDIFMHKNICMKMPRQTGKTWTASFIAVAYLLCGIDVMVAYPTLTQGWKLLLSKIAHICKILKIPLVRANKNGIELANGACVHVVTTYKGVESNRGYTVGLIIVDEAQNVDVSAMSALMSSTDKYKLMDLDTVIFMGTGGYRNKLLETAWRDRGFYLCHLKPDDIIRYDASYKTLDDEYKIILDSKGYRTEVLCEMIEGGNASVLKHMAEALPSPITMYYDDIIGVDIGQMQDSSVVSHLRVYPGSTKRVEVVETLRLQDTYDVQCPKIKQWIYDRGLQKAKVSVEINGIGRAIFDYLNTKDKTDPTPLVNVHPFTCSHKSKKSMIHKIQRYDYDHALHITDKPMRDALCGLCEYYDDDGNWKIDHSDYLSSLICAFSKV